ncbi:unnamed protein product [Closterium sp. NIES-64]|nr:unnamed protein product [Closterium sp. NIES-64]
MAALKDLSSRLGAPPSDVYIFVEVPLLPALQPYLHPFVGRNGNDMKRLSIGLLYSADGAHRFRPIVVSADREPLRLGHDLFTQFMLGLNAAKFAEDRDIVVLVSSRRHKLTWGEGKREPSGPFMVHHLTHTRIVQLHDVAPDVGNPVVQGIVTFFRSEFRTMWVDHQTRFMRRVPPAWVWTSNSPSAANTLQWTFQALWGVATSHIQLAFWRTGCVPDEWLPRLQAINRDLHVKVVEQLVVSLTGLQRRLDQLDILDCVMDALDYATWDDTMDEDTAERFPEPVIRRIDDSSCVGRVKWDDRTRRRFMRMASDAYTRLASATGVAPSVVVTLKRLGNPDLVDRLLRTPEKKVRRHSYAPSSSMSSTASEEICFNSPTASLGGVHGDIEYGM